jgi:transposase
MAISLEKRQMILRLHKKGMSMAAIANEVAVHRSTVVRLLKHQRETGDITPGQHPGRPRLLTPRDERDLVKIVRKEPTTRPSTLRNALHRTNNHVISTRTVQRTLHRAGLVAARMRRKPRLKPEQRRARLKWAKEYAQKPADFWDTVIFSDESSFHSHETMRGKYVWRYQHEDLEPGFVLETSKFGGSKLQVWGCLTSQGVGWACALPEGLDSETYLGILKEELTATIAHYFKSFKGVVFQQDGAGVHTANKVKEYFQKQKYSVLPWPAHSPDLSPIENLWADLKRRLVEKHPEIPKAKIWEVVDAEWESTPKEFCAKLLHSMPERLQAVIKAKGGYTNY